MPGSSQNPVSLAAYRPVDLPGMSRVGRDFDGGYVVPRSVIERSHTLLSLGVNDDWSFEEAALAINPALRVTCVDGTTGMKRIVVKALKRFPQMLGHALSMQRHKAGRDWSCVRKPIEFRRFFSRHELLQLMVGPADTPGWITMPALLERATAGHDDWVLLKTDIEGAEYAALPGALERMDRVSALLIEFHDLDRQWDAFSLCMQGLMRTFHVAHVHGNNFDACIPGTRVPKTIEMTLVNRALVAGTPRSSTVDYPRAGLDMPNSRKRPELPLDFY
jgi:hypothetical protein